MKLSIIIPAFNEAAYLGAALDSLEAAAAHLRAHSGAEVEVIVVDNNSTDDTAAIARSKRRKGGRRARCRGSRGPGTPGRAMLKATCSSSSTRT